VDHHHCAKSVETTAIARRTVFSRESQSDGVLLRLIETFVKKVAEIGQGADPWLLFSKQNARQRLLLVQQRLHRHDGLFHALIRDVVHQLVTKVMDQ
jgi:hypothetical protein